LVAALRVQYFILLGTEHPSAVKKSGASGNASAKKQINNAQIAVPANSMAGVVLYLCAAVLAI
jgi:hypothetical protein